jgi:MFS family permease
MHIDPSFKRREEPRAYAWAVVALLFFVALLNYLDRLAITTLRDPIRSDISMSDARFGLLTSAFLWSYAAVSPLGGMLADRFGRRVVIIASLLFWSGATALTGFATSFGQILSARLLMGISEACYLPAALAMITDYHRDRTRSLATGIHMIGIYAGAALGGVAAVIAEHYGWRFGFKLLGVVGILYSLLLLFTLRDAHRGQTALKSDRVPMDIGSATGAVLTPAFIVLFVVNLLVGVVNWSVYGWLPTFMRERFHLGLGAAGLSATGYIQAASFVGVLFAGAVADRWSQRARHARAFTAAIGLLVGGPFLMAAASAHLLPVAVAGLVAFGLGRGAIDANQMPLLRQVIDERYSALGYGLLNFASTTAGGIMVYAGGAMLDAHVDLARIFQAAGAGLFVGGILLWMIPRLAFATQFQPESGEFRSVGR